VSPTTSTSRTNGFILVTSMHLASPLRLPQHANQHRPERPVLLAVDQEFGEGATLRVAPELSDPVGPVEVGEHEDVEQLGASGRRERAQAFTKSALELVGPHAAEPSGSSSSPIRRLA
jgi:hypothetical protein